MIKDEVFTEYFDLFLEQRKSEEIINEFLVKKRQDF